MTHKTHNNGAENEARQDRKNNADAALCGEKQGSGRPSCCDPSIETCCTASGCLSDDPHCCGKSRG